MYFNIKNYLKSNRNDCQIHRLITRLFPLPIIFGSGRIKNVSRRRSFRPMSPYISIFPKKEEEEMEIGEHFLSISQ